VRGLQKRSETGVSLRIDEVVNYLIKTYKEYERKKREPFKASVRAGKLTLDYHKKVECVD